MRIERDSEGVRIETAEAMDIRYEFTVVRFVVCRIRGLGILPLEERASG